MSENRFEAARAYIDNLERVFKDMMSEEHKAHMTNIRTLLDQAINAPDLLEVLKEANAELNRRNSYDVQYKTTYVLVNVQKAIKDYGERKC